MSDPDKEATKDLIRGVLAAHKSRPTPPKPVPKRVEEKPKRKPTSTDALDHQSTRGKFSKAEKQAYARKMHEEALLEQPKNPPPAWLSDPTLLPKKPPGRTGT